MNGVCSICENGPAIHAACKRAEAIECLREMGEEPTEARIAEMIRYGDEFDALAGGDVGAGLQMALNALAGIAIHPRTGQVD